MGMVGYVEVCVFFFDDVMIGFCVGMFESFRMYFFCGKCLLCDVVVDWFFESVVMCLKECGFNFGLLRFIQVFVQIGVIGFFLFDVLEFFDEEQYFVSLFLFQIVKEKGYFDLCYVLMLWVCKDFVMFDMVFVIYLFDEFFV